MIDDVALATIGAMPTRLQGPERDERAAAGHRVDGAGDETRKEEKDGVEDGHWRETVGSGCALLA